MLLGVAAEHYTRQPILLQYHIIIFKCDMCDKFSSVHINSNSER
jgi:hypothetical protein